MVRTRSICAAYDDVIRARSQRNRRLYYARSRIKTVVRYTRAVYRESNLAAARDVRRRDADIYKTIRRREGAIRRIAKRQTRRYDRNRIVYSAVYSAIYTRSAAHQIEVQEQISIVMHVVALANVRIRTIEIIFQRPRYPMPYAYRKIARYPITQLHARVQHKARTITVRCICFVVAIAQAVQTTAYARRTARRVDVLITVQLRVKAIKTVVQLVELRFVETYTQAAINRKPNAVLAAQILKIQTRLQRKVVERREIIVERITVAAARYRVVFRRTDTVEPPALRMIATQQVGAI